jgi:hypothetical protein
MFSVFVSIEFSELWLQSFEGPDGVFPAPKQKRNLLGIS